MNKFTARGLVETAYAESSRIAIIVGGSVAEANDAIDQAVADLGLPAANVMRAAGLIRIIFDKGGSVVIRRSSPASLRGMNVDVVYFDHMPSGDEERAARMATMVSRGEVISQ